MLEVPHYPELSRVIRVAPAANEKPAPGFSWQDYEDVEDLKGADADGEDDGGWGVVKSRGKASEWLVKIPHSYLGSDVYVQRTQSVIVRHDITITRTVQGSRNTHKEGEAARCKESRRESW